MRVFPFTIGFERLASHRGRRIEASHPMGEKGFTKAGIRKMIARLH